MFRRIAFSAISILVSTMTLSSVAAPAASASEPVPGVAAKFFALRAHAQTSSRTYIVKAGQSLSMISKAVYGHSRWWPELYWRNTSRIHDRLTMTIYPGEHLRVPEPWRHRPAVPRAYQAPVPTAVAAASGGSNGATSSVGAAPAPAGIYGYAALEQLWDAAGGPSWAAPAAASVAQCESGGRSDAYNPSGATGLWQILGSVVSGDLRDPMTNARNAVSKFNASGGTWAQWVCQPSGHAYGAAVGVMTAHRHRFVPLRLLAFQQALRYKDHWYGWGGIGPSVFDCSGLVYRSYLNLGHLLPRDTYGMLGGGGHLHFTSRPRKGMLSFYGSGHVELYVRPGVTFGAHHTGTKIGYTYYNGYYHPTMYMWVSRR